MTKQFKHLALGGTFDLLHSGHRGFLEFAFRRAQKVSIGICTDEMVRNNGKKPVQVLKVRMMELKKFLVKKNFITRSKIVLLNDMYGSTLSDESIERLVVTKETSKGGTLINRRRGELGLGPLKILVCPMIDADDGESISSSRIKQGLINRQGFSYYRFLSSRKKFILPKSLRRKLAKPLGNLFRKIDDLILKLRQVKDLSLLIAVGDETTRTLIQKGLIPNLAIVDLKVNREVKYQTLGELGLTFQKYVTVRNKPGTISKSLIRSINNFFRERVRNIFVIKVLGEEDLAVLPTVLLAPLKSTIVYGQKNKGLVLVKVTEEEKANFFKIMNLFVYSNDLDN